jgi:hypothetical protein
LGTVVQEGKQLLLSGSFNIGIQLCRVTDIDFAVTVDTNTISQ